LLREGTKVHEREKKTTLPKFEKVARWVSSIAKANTGASGKASGKASGCIFSRKVFVGEGFEGEKEKLKEFS
jgi:hypothetical protein